MKSIYATPYLRSIAFIIILISCESKETPIQKINASTPHIKSILESVHEPDKSSRTMEHEPEAAENSTMTRTSFNRNAQLTSVYQYDWRGNLQWREVLRYDEKGNNTETLQYHLNEMTSRRISTYNEKNQLIESKVYNSEGKNIGKQSVQFNGDGKSIVTYEWVNDSFLKTSERFYNLLGQNTENQFFERSTLTLRETNRFDQHGNLVEAIQYRPSRKEETITHHKYDSRQNRIETITLNSSLMIEARLVSTYNDQRLMVDQFTYGLLGNLKEQVKHVYEYDKAGNWIKDVTLIGKKPDSIRIRQIEYY